MKIISDHKYLTTSLSLWLLLLLVKFGESGTIVRTLPGYSGLLPFKLETGYVSVNESELFYLFVESQGKPLQDPLLVYLIGGPGCSTLNGFFFQVGPLVFNTTNYAGGLPQLLDNPYAWTKTASIIFLDAPVGTGFSYATTPSGNNITDIISSEQVHIFLRKWLLDHEQYSKTQFFIASDSYAGVITPIIAQYILDGNEAGLHPHINLKGILSGSPHIDSPLENNAVVPLAYRLALISKTLYESAKNSCKENYVDLETASAECLEDMAEIDELLEMINDENILDPKCATIHPNVSGEVLRRSLQANSSPTKFIQSPKLGNYWCRNFEYILLDVWANDESVQDALYVRKGTVTEFYRCNLSISHETYTVDVSSAVGYYKNLTSTGLQILLYTGDHDLVVPYISTETWIESLNITVDTAWRPWFVEGQIAGYTVKYTDYGFRLTFATLKGSGHSPTQYMPLQCFNMFERWIHYYPL